MPLARILIAEKDAIIVTHIQGCITRLGYECAGIAFTPEEAISKAAETQPDLVLIDTGLEAILDGVNAAERICATRDIPIVYLTSFSDSATIEWAKVTEPFGYVLKPFSERELQVTLAMALHNYQLRRALRAKEQLFDLIVGNITDTIWLMDLNLHSIYISPSLVRLRGYSLEELLAMPWQQHLAPASQETAGGLIATHFSPAHLQAGDQAEALTLDLEFCRQDGSTTWAETRFSLLRDAQGKPTGIVGVGRDITERRQAEDRLRANHALINAMLDSAPYIVMVVNREGRVEHINRAGSQFAGRSEEQLTGLLGGQVFNCVNSFAGKGCGKNEPCLDCPVRTRVTYTFETGESVQEAEGQLTVLQAGRPVSVDLAVWCTLLKVDQDAERVLVTIADVTQRRRLEAALRSSEARYRAIFDGMLDGFALHEIILDEDGEPQDYRFLSVNPAFEQLTGLKAENILGKRVLEVLPKTEPYWIKNFAQVVSSGLPLRFENYSQEIGKYFDVVAFRPAAGQFASIFQDVTQKMQAEKLLKLQRDLGLALGEAADLHHGMQAILDIAVRVQGVDCGGLYRVDPVRGEADLVVHTGLSEDFVRASSHYGAAMVGNWIAGDMQPVYTQYAHYVSEAGCSPALDGLRALALLPISSEGHLIALLGLGSHGVDEISPESRMLLESIALLTGSVVARLGAAEALRQSEKRFSAIIHLAPIGVAIADEQGNVVECNEHMSDIVGYTRSELLGMNFASFTHPDDLATERALIASLRANERQNYRLEKRYLHKSGRVVWVDLIASLTVEPGGICFGFAFVQDITERRLAEEELRFQSLILNQIRDQITATDLQGRIVYVNDAVARILGRSQAELLGQSVNIYGEDETRGATQDEIIALTREQGEWQGEVVNYTSTGADVVLSCRTRLVIGEDGSPTGMIGIATDVTAYKHAQESLQRHAHQLAVLSNVAQDIAALMDVPQMLEHATRLLVERFGYDHVAIFLLEAEQGAFVMQAVAGQFEKMYPGRHRLEFGKGMVGWVGAHRETLLANDVSREPRYVNLYPDQIQSRAELTVPIQHRDHFLGVLDIQSRDNDAFDDSDVLTMEALANQLAIAIENAHLFDAVQGELMERRLIQEKLQWELAVNKALAELSQPLIAPSTTADRIAAVVLQEACRLTASKWGCVVEIDPATGKDGILATLSDGECSPSALETLPGFMATLDWGGGAMDRHQPFYTNTPFSWGTEEQSPCPIEAVLLLPVLWGEELVGQILLANPGREYGPQDIEALKGFSVIYALAIHRLCLDDQLRQIVKEKELLLKEVYHRVKNNMQVVSSILSLSVDQIQDPKALEVFRESQNRVKSMAFIHEKLYQAKDLQHINFAGYLQSLVMHLQQSYRVPQVEIVVQAEMVLLDIDQAIPCGLIVTELVSNAIKYAFVPGQAGTICVAVTLESGHTVLTVQDNGRGLPADLDIWNPPSLGLQLVGALTRQLNGVLEVSSFPREQGSSHHGTIFSLRFGK